MKNRKTPARTRRHRESVAAKRRARRFYALRQAEERGPAGDPPRRLTAPEWALAVLAGLAALGLVAWAAFS